MPTFRSMRDIPEHVRELMGEAMVKSARRSKYGNTRCEADGLKFDSKRERDYYIDLKARKAANDLRWFARQVSFDLPGKIRYVADFVVVENDGRVRVVDCKGVRTSVYIMKRKLMKATWGIEIEEV